MTAVITRYVEASFAVAVTGAGLSPFPWLALIVCAAYLLGLAYVASEQVPLEDQALAKKNHEQH